MCMLSVLWCCMRCLLSKVLPLDTKQCISSSKACFGSSTATTIGIFGLQCPLNLTVCLLRKRTLQWPSLHDADVTSGHAFLNPGMALSPLWCLEMAEATVRDHLWICPSCNLSAGRRVYGDCCKRKTSFCVKSEFTAGIPTIYCN